MELLSETINFESSKFQLGLLPQVIFFCQTSKFEFLVKSIAIKNTELSAAVGEFWHTINKVWISALSEESSIMFTEVQYCISEL
jgi:hypothetical protein